MTDEEADRLAAEDYEQEVEHETAAAKEQAERGRRYGAMIAQVEEWEPPTKGHQGLKDFMLSQLTDADPQPETNHIHWGVPELETGDAFRQREIERAQDNILYHTDEQVKQTLRNLDRAEYFGGLLSNLEVL